MTKILLIYPNKEAYPFIPLSFSILSSILKANGHEVDLFDITFLLGAKRLDHYVREKIGIVKKTNIDEYWGVEKKDINIELVKKINTFSPDIIGFSIVENNYECAKHLMAVIKTNFGIPIIVGGTFPTIETQRFIDDPNVDMICIGEGEEVLLDVANNLNKYNIAQDKTYQFTSTKFYNWEPFIPQDWSIFDTRHFMKPFLGKVFKTGCFELSRGCTHNCNFCVNAFYQKKFKSLGKYKREKPLEYAIKEMAYLKNKYALELIWFHDENFCLMKNKRLFDFCKQFKDEIALPFFIQSSAETLIKESRIKMLKNAGCITISIGLETGNEQIRANKLNKHIKNEIFMQAFANCRKYGIRTTANIMIGLPGETEKEILETVNFCKQCDPDSIGVSIFAPYYGTALRDVCIKMNLIEDKDYKNLSFKSNSILKMPQMDKNKFNELFYNFNALVFGSKK